MFGPYGFDGGNGTTTPGLPEPTGTGKVGVRVPAGAARGDALDSGVDVCTESDADGAGDDSVEPWGNGRVMGGGASSLASTFASTSRSGAGGSMAGSGGRGTALTPRNRGLTNGCTGACGALGGGAVLVGRMKMRSYAELP